MRTSAKAPYFSLSGTNNLPPEDSKEDCFRIEVRKKLGESLEKVLCLFWKLCLVFALVTLSSICKFISGHTYKITIKLCL